jgi:hypothetical protein
VESSPQKGIVIATVSLSRLTRGHRLGAFESIPLRRFMFTGVAKWIQARKKHRYFHSAFVSFNPWPPARRV